MNRTELILRVKYSSNAQPNYYRIASLSTPIHLLQGLSTPFISLNLLPYIMAGLVNISFVEWTGREVQALQLPSLDPNHYSLIAFEVNNSAPSLFSLRYGIKNGICSQY